MECSEWGSYCDSSNQSLINTILKVTGYIQDGTKASKKEEVRVSPESPPRPLDELKLIILITATHWTVNNFSYSLLDTGDRKINNIDRVSVLEKLPV